MSEKIKFQEVPPSKEMLQIPGHGSVEIIDLSPSDPKNTIGFDIRCVDERPIQEIPKKDNEKSIFHDGINKMPEKYENAAGIPGGSLELAIIVKNVLPKYSPEQAVNLIIDWSEHMNIPLSTHTRCGHLKLVSENPEEYGLKKGDAGKMIDHLKVEASKGKITISEPDLVGNHDATYIQEIITDPINPKTVKQLDSNGEKSFKLDETANTVVLKNLANYIIDKNRQELSGKTIQYTPEQLFNKFYKIYKDHNNKTLKRLAPNLPVFENNLTGKIPTVTQKSPYGNTIPQ